MHDSVKRIGYLFSFLIFFYFGGFGQNSEPTKQETIDWLQSKYSQYSTNFIYSGHSEGSSIYWNICVISISFKNDGIYIVKPKKDQIGHEPSEDEKEEWFNGPNDCVFVGYDLISEVFISNGTHNISLKVLDNLSNCDGTRRPTYTRAISCAIDGSREPDLINRAYKAIQRLIELSPKRKKNEAF
jgi:hypothetical protein